MQKLPAADSEAAAGIGCFNYLYAEEDISGTDMNTRASLMKMLRDARKKKFDLSVTREVSRFPRNTVDTLVTVC